jgi:hypothetical protein
MPRPRRIAAALAAASLAMSFAACGDDDVERGNPGETPDGPAEVETGPTTLGSTGEDQPEITQTQTTP